MEKRVCASCGAELPAYIEELEEGEDSLCPVCARKELEEALGIDRESTRKRAVNLLILFIIGLLAVLLYATLERKQRERQDLLTCLSNQVAIRDALKAYTADHDGKLPGSLKDLVPAYMKELPVCPKTKTESYSSTYRRGSSVSKTDYTCEAEEHAIPPRE